LLRRPPEYDSMGCRLGLNFRRAFRARRLRDVILKQPRKQFQSPGRILLSYCIKPALAIPHIALS